MTNEMNVSVREEPILLFGLKKDRIASIEMNDFLIRAFISNGPDLANAKVYEFPLPPGVVEEEVVQDEMAFFEIGKQLVKAWNISRHDLRFFVPDHAVMMRAFEYPANLASDKLKGYVEMELGRSIHLPFSNPLIDVYDPTSDDGKAVIFAAPAEDITKLMRLYQDLNLHPTVLEVKALANIRFLEKTKRFKKGETYLIADWAVNALSISIYSEGNVDFLRYQPIETVSGNWTTHMDAADNIIYTFDGNIDDYRMQLTNQVLEMDRILNFYRFSLHKGEKAVDHILLLGDNPEMKYIEQQLESTVEPFTHIIDNAYVKEFYPKFEAKHSALIGLALKGEVI
jgi:type IV pilus assembly protein PilM